ncbi:hypothetical protein HDU92_001079 [Lobulomyces angularis]|nr:hypothetical protein HDU92_001079 [Lobulomyces angularis]
MKQIKPKKENVIVIKLGSSSICDSKLHIRLSTLSLLVETIKDLREKGNRVVLVSSGAVAVGLRRMHLKKRPKHLSQVQALAAIGQGRLMALYDELFGQFDIPIAQILLTRDNISERSQYLNACNTFKELLDMSIVPIVNENDSVCNAEIRFGDNDTLSAIVAGMVNANHLFLLTDVPCLYTDNPNTNPDAKPVRYVDDLPKLRGEIDVSGAASSNVGTGGMVTKLIAADLATAVGCATVILISTAPEQIGIFINEFTEHNKTNSTENFIPSVGTLFAPKSNPLQDRKWWILNGLASYGKIFLDAGAVSALKNKNSLFATGVIKVQGNFTSNQKVNFYTVVRKDNKTKEDFDEFCDIDDINSALFQTVEIGSGLVNYNSTEVNTIKGLRSHLFVEKLGYIDSECICHRDNMVITKNVEVFSIVNFKKNDKKTT